jgi:GNAT superfamily N-acetyltransferase
MLYEKVKDDTNKRDFSTGAYISSALAITQHLSDLLFTNRASIHPTHQDPNPLTQANFERRIGPFMHQFYNHRQYWELLTLATHPDHQGRGIGRELVAWGLERASQEDVPAVVCAAKGLEGFYQSCGFVEMVGWACEAEVDGLVNPLKERGIGGGAVLWTRGSEGL